jgi:hypothetical protein
MLFVYVDDVLAVSYKGKEVLEEIGALYRFQEGSLKKPEIYLGANLSEFQLPDRQMAWSTSPCDYVKNAIKTVEDLLEEDGEGYTLKSNIRDPFPKNYHKPELDIVDKLDMPMASTFQQLIGICQWEIEIR